MARGDGEAKGRKFNINSRVRGNKKKIFFVRPLDGRMDGHPIYESYEG